MVETEEVGFFSDGISLGIGETLEGSPTVSLRDSFDSLFRYLTIT
jgi:hypothetical protein